LNVKHAVTFVDAINWAFFNTGLVLNIDAWFCDYVGHGTPFEVT
jgi:hypothetical protein